MACNKEAEMELVTVRFTNLSPDLEWKDYFDLFGQFGQVNKLFIHPTGSFGRVHFLNVEDAYKAQKELDGKPPLKLAIAEPVTFVSSQLSSVSSNTSLLENSSTMYRRDYNRYNNNNNDDVDVVPSKNQYVDVYGRILDTLESEDSRQVYVPISDLKKSGFEVFLRGSLPKPGQLGAFDEQLFHQHEIYLRIKSRKFMNHTRQTFPEHKLDGVIDKLQDEYRSYYQQGAVDNEARSMTFNSPSFTSSPASSQNRDSNKGRTSSERNSFGGQERRVHATYTTNTNSANNCTDATTNNFQSRRSYSDEKSFASPTTGLDKGYFNNRNGLNKNSAQAEEPVNISKPPLLEPLIKGTPQQVKVVHLETESIAWVQLSSNINLIRDIIHETKEESSKADVIPPAFDKICAALYSNIWFRVLIISTYPLTVQFIDFGSQCAEDIKEVRKLSSKLCNIPCQAIRISMEFGSEITLEPCMMLTVVPIMQEPDGTYLVRAQKLSSANEPSPPKPKVSFSEDAVSRTKSTPSPSDNKPFLRRPNLSEEEIKPEVEPSPIKNALQVTTNASQTAKPQRKTVIEKETDSGYFDCTEIINENTFVGVAMPATYVEEVCILDDITTDCKPDLTFKPNLGDTVAVCKDDAYVRGVVINNLNGRYTCALIDYGVTMSVDEVCPLPDKYMNIPEFACVCKADPDIIQEISKGSEHLMKIKSPSRITVTVKDSEKVYEIIGCLWNPFETSPLAIKNKLLEEKPIKEEIKKEKEIYKTPLKLYQLKPSDVVIVISEIEGSLILRTRECDITLKDIKQELNNYQGKPFTQQPEVNQLVVCPFSDGALYRGIVLSVKGSNAEVEYVDYGNHELVPIKELRTISEKLANLPSTCIKILLKGFIKSKFTSKALAYLEDCAKRREKFTTVSGNDGQVYDLLFRDNSSLSEKLIALDKPSTVTSFQQPEALPAAVKCAVAVTPSSAAITRSPAAVTPSPPAAVAPSPKAVTPSPKAVTPSPAATTPSPAPIILTDIPKCTLNMGYNEVMCLFAGDAAEGTASFCVADPDKVANKMMELSDKINACIEKDSTPYHPKQFEVCLAQYEGDWYRAAFIKGFENSYGMFYLDYGNTKTVTADDIRKMPKELGEIECLSALCILQGVKEDEGPIQQPLRSKLVNSINENEIYEIRVIKEENNCYVITIPLLFDEWKKEGLLS